MKTIKRLVVSFLKFLVANLQKLILILEPNTNEAVSGVIKFELKQK